ncbi:DUF4410 domain-containing protein [Gluconacetobacter sacchari]|uniref:DUF4410 domain-containing protein n=2 Tax=Gluconacetobacter sacchari TaxID=92759 RepID=A0A7W4NLC6_9PROT|nr:DUF4410 domain-containing protein [Gluconacetobacter sacchari]MBB2159899.1 DUF4410 domain-containing protein [Gluconacetobacter sacchari]
MGLATLRPRSIWARIAQSAGRQSTLLSMVDWDVIGLKRTNYDLAMLAGLSVNGDSRPMDKYPSHTRCPPGLSVILLCLPLLAGCAGTHVVSESMTAPPARLPRPHSISIVVSDTSPLPKKAKRVAGHSHDVQIAEADLTQDLTHLLAARNLAVVPPGQAADLTLQCVITQVRSGSAIARLLIGYGAGKALLRVSTTLSVPHAEKPTLLTFSTSSTTGAMPGAGFGIASAAGSAGTAVHMIGPVLGIPGTLRQGLGQEAQQTTTRIDDELARYFSQQEWPYPRPPQSFWSRI